MPNPIPSSPTSCPTCHAIFRHPESVCSDAFHGPSPTSEGREESLPRYAIGIREFHSALGVEHDYADLSIERHAEGDWVKFADVCASLTAAQAEIAELHDIVSDFDSVTNPEEFPELHERAFKAIGGEAGHEWCRKMEEAQAEIERLKDWRSNVTAALMRPGGAHYEDVAKHVKAMRQTLADVLEDWEQLAGDGVEVNPPDFIVRAHSILGLDGAQ